MKGIDKKLDDCWSLITRQKGKCEIKDCAVVNSLNSHHIIGRRNHTTRWDLRNGVCLCSGHHVFSLRSAHQDPEWFHDWLEENRKEDIDYLRQRRNIILKRTKKDKEGLLEELKAKLKETNEDRART
jgi:predicted restriction endonuclease